MRGSSSAPTSEPSACRTRPWLVVPVVAGCLVTAAACAPAVPRVTPRLVAVAGPGADATTLEQGRRIYVERCSTCHALPRPADYTAEQWRDWLRRMAPKGKLDATESARALDFLLAARQVPPE